MGFPRKTVSEAENVCQALRSYVDVRLFHYTTLSHPERQVLCNLTVIRPSALAAGARVTAGEVPGPRGREFAHTPLIVSQQVP